MSIISRRLKQATLAALALSSFGAVQSAYAIGTEASTVINNRATVEYAVGGVTQAVIESSPTGNSTPGASQGANTTFVVDNRIDFTVAELGASATIVNPGQVNVVATFTVTNSGNSNQGYQLSAANETGTTLFSNVDNIDVANLRVFVDSNGNGTYDSGVDTATNIDTLIADSDGESVVVFVIADVPLTATNTSFANVRLTARAAAPGTAGGTLVTESTGADSPTTVDVVFADAGRDATESAADQYDVASAALSVSKTATVIRDPINSTTNPKAIPLAVVEYAIVVNNSGAVSADTVGFSDPIPVNTTFLGAEYGGSDIEIQNGASTITCSASAADADGCSVASGVLTIGGAARPTIAAGGIATVRFRVTIN